MALKPKVKKWLSEKFETADVKFHEPMSRHTSFRVGGPADALVTPASTKDLNQLLGCLRGSGTPYRVIGGGTNLLVSDDGIQGVVISLKRCLNHMETISSQGPAIRINVGAGVNTQRFCRFAIAQGYAGMNFAIGIPGTIGGAVMLNAGTPEGAISDVLSAIHILIPPARVQRVWASKALFSYRKLHLPGPQAEGAPPVILAADFALKLDDPAQLQQEAAHRWQQRRQRQPYDAFSAGSFFKNPPSGPTAGELIDRAGLKGACVGGAMVSEKHANFIVNTGSATAADILSLMHRIQQVVAEKFGVQLEPEVHIIGP